MGSRIKESPESTFELYLEVTHPGAEGSGPPEVRRQYPEDYSDQETLQTVPKFCFPFIMDSLTVSQVGQNFTFVLTDIESKQRFGFCRLSSGAQNCYCIISYLPWFEVFYKLLNILADYTIKGQQSEWEELLVSLHTLPVPDAGTPVHLSTYTCFTVPNIRELPSIPENRNLTEYFVAVDVNNMLHLYASMLFERRILICCSKLSTLTACVHGSAAMLYPMFWQHVYIPVLPQHLVDYCCAPMPYLIGVHSSLMEKVRGMALDDVVVLNVDTNTLETPFEDLQTLPSDVISSLKNRLKKVSITTGEGVARAFLKSQASLFGSYRNALQIEPGEPITFNEETFLNHRSNTMRQFLHNAIQLQLFKQFVDGRLDLLNSGEGFSDVFEEEINMGEYAGSDKIYHQWLLSVKKGGGAIFNTMRNRANPAMKTVYKFAKDHAKMGIKEVRSRLKQKEQAENGYTTAGVAAIDHDGSSGAEQREGVWSTLDHRRPVTVHFGQARPPRPLMMKRPSSNVGLDATPDLCGRPTRHYTVFLSEDSSEDELQRDDQSASGFNETFLFSSFEWSPLPQPYRSLKEVESAEGGGGQGAEHRTAPPSPTMTTAAAGDVLSNVSLLGELFSCQDEPEGTQPLSLAKSLEDLRTPNQLYTFNHQRMDLSANERTCTLPGLKLSHPYTKQWSGLDDMAVPVWASPGWERAPSEAQQEALPPGSSESFGPGPAFPDPSGGESRITIPRPQGRKTPEPGKILAPHVTKPRTTPTGAREGRTSAGGQEFRQALGMSPGEDLLKPARPEDDDDLDLLNLLDPLNDSAQSTATTSLLYEGGESTSSASKPSLPPRPNLPGLPCLPPYVHATTLNPFAQGLRATSPLTHYSPTVGVNPFAGVYGVSPVGPYFHGPPRPHPPSALPELYRAYSPGTFTAGFRPHGSAFPTAAAGASLPRLSASNHALSALADSPSVPILAPRKPPKTGADSPPAATQDFFGDLLTMAKPATPPKKKADDLRRRWETFD